MNIAEESREKQAANLVQEALHFVRSSRKFGIRVVALPSTIEALRKSDDPEVRAAADNILSTDDLYSPGAFGETLLPPNAKKPHKNASKSE